MQSLLMGINFGIDWTWILRSNLTLKSNIAPFWVGPRENLSDIKVSISYSFAASWYFAYLPLISPSSKWMLDNGTMQNWTVSSP